MLSVSSQPHNTCTYTFLENCLNLHVFYCSLDLHFCLIYVKLFVTEYNLYQNRRSTIGSTNYFFCIVGNKGEGGGYCFLFINFCSSIPYLTVTHLASLAQACLDPTSVAGW